MTKRIRTICAALSAARVFADVGCDHGYMTRYMFDRNLCERAYISDVSAGSLRKAEALLKGEVEEGRCIPVVADGLDGIGEACDLVLIAGLGGEEIVRILARHALPPRFVLQPMRNSGKLRAHLLERGAQLDLDYTFEDGKFYDLIAGTAEGGDCYSDFEIKYGRDNLRSPTADFLHYLAKEKAKLRARLARKGFDGPSRDEMRAKLYEMEVITDAAEGDL